jgi:hypothetical protein
VLTVKNPRGSALRRFLAIAALFAAHLVSANLFLQAGRLFAPIFADFPGDLPVLHLISTNHVVTLGFAVGLAETALLVWMLTKPAAAEYLLEVLSLCWLLLIIAYAVVLMSIMHPTMVVTQQGG